MSTTLVSTGITFPSGATQTTKEVMWTLLSTTTVGSPASTVLVSLDTATYKKFRIQLAPLTAYTVNTAITMGLMDASSNSFSSNLRGVVSPTAVIVSASPVIATSATTSEYAYCRGEVNLVVSNDRFSAMLQGVVTGAYPPFNVTGFNGSRAVSNAVAGELRGIFARTNAAHGVLAYVAFGSSGGIAAGSTIYVYGMS